MEQLRFQYKNTWESGAFQETHIGFSTFHCHSLDGLKPITRLGLSHLRFHKFKHSFQDILNPICSCGTVETTIHYLLDCHNFLNERLTLFKKLQSIAENILNKDDPNISKVLLFGEHLFNDVKNTSVLIASIGNVISTKLFYVPLYYVYMQFIFSFYQEIALSFMLFSFVFSIFTIACFRLFCKITYF